MHWRISLISFFNLCLNDSVINFKEYLNANLLSILILLILLKEEEAIEGGGKGEKHAIKKNKQKF